MALIGASLLSRLAVVHAVAEGNATELRSILSDIGMRRLGTRRSQKINMSRAARPYSNYCRVPNSTALSQRSWH